MNLYVYTDVGTWRTKRTFVIRGVHDEQNLFPRRTSSRASDSFETIRVPLTNATENAVLVISFIFRKSIFADRTRLAACDWRDRKSRNLAHHDRLLNKSTQHARPLQNVSPNPALLLNHTQSISSSVRTNERTNERTIIPFYF